jgi:hypothetical protein
MRRTLILSLPLAVVALAAPRTAAADDLTGAQSILCTSMQATICTDDGDCTTESPGELNIPQFLELDLKGKVISTTRASGENRSTPIRTLEKEGGLVFVQGIEQGRAFSFVISESSGMLSAAVARDGKAVSVFGACTPLSTSK